MEKYRVKLRSTCALLMHKFSAAAEAEAGPGGVKRTKTGPPKPEEEAEAGAYRLEPAHGLKKGQLCLPTEHFFQSMVLAASGFQVKGQGKKTYKDAIKGNILIDPQYAELCDHAGNPLFDYVIDARPARIKAARILRARPLIKQWQVEFELTVITDGSIPMDVLNSILVSAGQTRGVGDYRPRFGRFLVAEFNETKQT